MSSARFGKDEESVIGPGSYEIPTTLDDHAALILASGERFQEPPEYTGAFLIYEDDRELTKGNSRPSTSRRAHSAKENRQPLQANMLKGSAPNMQDYFELDQLRKRLAEEEKRRAQAEARAADLALAKKSASNAHAQIQSLEKKQELLQKELEEGLALKKEAQRRVCDLEAERGRSKKALYEKDQQAAALQKSLQSAKAQLEERTKKMDELTPVAMESESLRQEVGRLRAKLEEHQMRRLASPARHLTPRKASPVAKESQDLTECLLTSLEQRFVEYSAETDLQIQSLAQVQERLHEKIRQGAENDAQELFAFQNRLADQAEELERRRSQLRFVLEQSKLQEAQLEATLTVREVTFGAVLAIASGQLEEQRRDILLRCQEIESLELNSAEMKGKIYTMEESQQANKFALEAMERRLHGAEHQAQIRETEFAAEVERLKAERFEALAGRLEIEEALKKKNLEVDVLSKGIEDLKLEQLEVSNAFEIKVAQQQELLSEAQSECARLRSLEQDFKILEADNEDKQRQNRELLQSLQVFQADLKHLEADNRALRDAEALNAQSLDREMDLNAQNSGHKNHKQKIHYMLNLKEENMALRADLKKARQQLAQIDVNAVSASRNNASQRRASLTPPGKPLNPTCHSSLVGLGASVSEQARRLEEAIRQCNLKDRSIERLSMDYQHLLTLVDRAAVLNFCASSVEDSGKGAAAILKRLHELATQGNERAPPQTSQPQDEVTFQVSSLLDQPHPAKSLSDQFDLMQEGDLS